MQLSRLLAYLSLAITPLTSLGADPAGPTLNVSLRDCIELAIQNNLDVQISRRGPEISTYNLKGSYGAYDPNLSFGIGGGRSVSPARIDDQALTLPPSTSDFLYGGNQNGGFISGNLPAGGMSYSLGVGLSQRETSWAQFLGTNLVEFNTTQYDVGAALGELRLPLLRDFWIDSFRTTIEINKENLKRSELDLQQQLMVTLLQVEQAYYDLVYARETIAVQQTAFEAADRLLQENRKRVEVGAMAPLEEKSAEAQASASRASLIAAQGNYGTSMRILKNLISADYSPMRDTVLNPTEKLSAIPTSPQVQDSWLKGLTQRPDLEALRLALRQRNIDIRYQKNQLYPVLDLVGSYRVSGTSQGGPNGRGLPGAFDDVGRGSYPSSSIAVQFSMPLGNISARNNLRASRAALEQALLTLKKQEQQVMVEIDNAIAMVRTNFERVGATREAREFAKDAWDAEQKKLDNGKSTSYEVLLKQRDYIRTLSDEIQALSDYNKALADLSYKEGSILERHNLGIEIH
jgi:outer membrane protein TolC